jgi:hypothetical protein
MAQEITSPTEGFSSPSFQSFLASDYAQRLRREALTRSIILHDPECVTVPEFEVLDAWAEGPVEIVEGGATPTTAIWRERLSMTACDETAIENMVHTVTEEGQRTFLLVRGRTEASLETQLVLINDARDAAAADDNAFGCDIIRFTDTVVRSRYGAGRWQERWFADACGEEVALDILLEPGLDGATTYTISAAN